MKVRKRESKWNIDKNFEWALKSSMGENQASQKLVIIAFILLFFQKSINQSPFNFLIYHINEFITQFFFPLLDMEQFFVCAVSIETPISLTDN